MTLKEDILQYKESDGLVDTKPTHGDNEIGNSVYRDCYYLLLELRQEVVYDDMSAWRASLRTQQVIFDGKYVPGLYSRSIWKRNELQAHDDYIGIAAVSKLYDGGRTAREIIMYGSVNWNCWNNLAPFTSTFTTWFGRHPQFIAHLKFASGMRVGIFNTLTWCLGTFFGSFAPRTNTTAWMLNYLYVKTASKDNIFVRLVTKFFFHMLRKRFPKGMNEVFTEMVGDGHPLSYYQVD